MAKTIKSPNKNIYILRNDDERGVRLTYSAIQDFNPYKELAEFNTLKEVRRFARKYK